MKKMIMLLSGFCLAGTVLAQIERPVKWSYAARRTGQQTAELFLKADIADGWHIYSAYQQEGGPIRTSFQFKPAQAYQLSGPLTEPAPLSRFEKAFNMKVSFFEHTVVFRQKIKLSAATTAVQGKLTYMVCNDSKCLPPEDLEFNIPIK